MAERKTSRYHIKCGNKIVHRGITDDPDRRLSEHRRRYGSDVKMVKIGPRVTRESALRWEREGGKRL